MQSYSIYAVSVPCLYHYALKRYIVLNTSCLCSLAPFQPFSDDES